MFLALDRRVKGKGAEVVFLGDERMWRARHGDCRDWWVIWVKRAEKWDRLWRRGAE